MTVFTKRHKELLDFWNVGALTSSVIFFSLLAIDKNDNWKFEMLHLIFLSFFIFLPFKC